MLHADRRADPDIRAVEERVPGLDPLRGGAKRGADALAGIARLARVRLRARLRVGRAERGDADAERRAGPDVRAGHEAVALLDLAGRERELGLDGRAAGVRSAMRTLRTPGGTLGGRGLPCLARGAAVGLRGAPRRPLRVLRGLVRPVGHTDLRARPDIVARHERVRGLDGTRDEVIRGFDRVARIVGLGDVRRLARWRRRRVRGRGGGGGGGRGRGTRRPRAAAEPRAVTRAVAADGVIGREIEALRNGEERVALAGQGVDGAIIEGRIGGPLECLVGEGEMAGGAGLIIGEMIVKVDRVLLISALRIARIEVPKDNGLSILLLDVVGDFVVDTTIRGAVG